MSALDAARSAALEDLRARAAVCTRCPELVRSRRQVVFGTGPADAALMFVAEAPGAREDREDGPLAGEPGALLDELLASIGFDRSQVAVVTLVKCRPPENRNPLRSELESCQEYLHAQLATMRPVVVCALGNFVTKLLRGANTPITKVRGVEEVRTIGPRAVRLYPLVHPAAALYSPAGVAQLRADVARIPELLRLGPPAQPEQPAPVVVAPPLEPVAVEPAPDPEPDNGQLGLF